MTLTGVLILYAESTDASMVGPDERHEMVMPSRPELSPNPGRSRRRKEYPSSQSGRQSFVHVAHVHVLPNPCSMSTVTPLPGYEREPGVCTNRSLDEDAATLRALAADIEEEFDEINGHGALHTSHFGSAIWFANVHLVHSQPPPDNRARAPSLVSSPDAPTLAALSTRASADADKDCVVVAEVDDADDEVEDDEFEEEKDDIDDDDVDDDEVDDDDDDDNKDEDVDNDELDDDDDELEDDANDEDDDDEDDEENEFEDDDVRDAAAAAHDETLLASAAFDSDASFESWASPSQTPRTNRVLMT
jgi:hypothetical protein